MSNAFGVAEAALSKAAKIRRTSCISWSPSGWPQTATAPTGTGIVTGSCSTPFRAIRIGIPNAETKPYKIAKIAGCPSATWNDYVNPTGDGIWRNFTFAGKGAASDTIVNDRSAPIEVTAWPSPEPALPGNGISVRWTWTDWLPIESVQPDPTTGMYVVMLRWLNSLANQIFTYANGLFIPGWTGCNDINHGFDYAIGGYNNGADHVTRPMLGDMNWTTCQKNSPLNGTPLAIIQFLTNFDGIVAIGAGDSHQSGAGTTNSFNGFLAQTITRLGCETLGQIPFGFVNCAVGGIASREMFSRLDSLLPVVRPSFAVLPGWTYNEVHAGIHANEIANGIFLYELLQAANTCHAYGVQPIFLTPFPRDEAAMSLEVINGWWNLRNTILGWRLQGALVIDAGAALGRMDGSRLTGTYLPGLSDDDIHPNDAGHARVAKELVLLIKNTAGLHRDNKVTSPATTNTVHCSAVGDPDIKRCDSMKTLVFCTSYAETLSIWNERWGRWLSAVVGSGVKFDKILIVDDGSPVLPDWTSVKIVSAHPISADVADAEIHHFADRRGQRVNGEPFPGWYRSFAYAVLYGIREGFDRIIHIEADAFLISNRAVEYFNSCCSGWIALWCQRHHWPESTLQIINKDQFYSCEAFFSLPYSAHLSLPYKSPEQLIPFTYINRSLIGDRYGEDGDIIPVGVDYVSQVKWNMGQDYYWWLTETGTRKSEDLGTTKALSFAPIVNKERKSMPRIVALSMVKNEQDIIEPFTRHTSKFVDFHVILDNGSVDETRPILTKLMRELDGVVVTTSSEFGYRQSERMSRLLRVCQAAFFADYVIFLDADEFISCENRSVFEEIVARIPMGGYGCIPWRTFVITPFDLNHEKNDPPRSMPWRRIQEHERTNVVLRLDGKYMHDIVIAQGAHNVSTTTGRSIAPIRLDGLYLNHFPIRSRDQFVAKSIVGWMAYLGKDPDAAKKGEGYHWRENYNLAVNGPLMSYEQLCDLSMQYDLPPRDYHWSTDVIRDVPPDGYERRYSTGKYDDPLSVIAKSWKATLTTQQPVISFIPKTPDASVVEQPKAKTAFDSQWHWENPFADVPPFQYLFEKYQPLSVLDVGCGIGTYLKIFQRFGVKKVFGVDGISTTATMLQDAEYREVDLACPINLGQNFDIVLCLEVAEHLPFEATSTILETIRIHADGLIVFSAAEPGQPGHGHINSLAIEHWLRRWQAIGWFPVLKETLTMRAVATLPWFKRNILVLRQGTDRNSEDAIQELIRIGARPYAWHHTNPGVRAEILIDDMPAPPFGYKSEI